MYPPTQIIKEVLLQESKLKIHPQRSAYIGTIIVAFITLFAFAFTTLFLSKEPQAAAITSVNSISPTVGSISGGDTITLTGTGFMPTAEFSYTGDVQVFKAPADGYYQLEVWGAGGSLSQNNIGGKGGYSTGAYYLDKDDELYVYVGQAGVARQLTAVSVGFNGGGGYSNPHSNGDNGAGGGATDVRLVGGQWDDPVGLNSRLIVAGGGGGAADNRQIGGAGGGANGINGQSIWDLSGTAYGGSQVAAGDCVSGTVYTGCGVGADLGVGATAGRVGGGGGYYGGGATLISGAGGSGYIGGVTSSNSVSPITIAGDSSMPNSDGSSSQIVGHPGDGFARITSLIPPTITMDGILVDNIQLIDDTTLSFTTPPNQLGPVDVVIDDGLGNTFTIENGFTYSPTVETISPTTGPANGRNTITLTADMFTCPIDRDYYVDSDMVLWLDGIDNTSSGHNPSETVNWYDLSPEGNNLVLAYPQLWGDSYLNNAATNLTTDDIPINDGIFTIEITERRDSFAYAAMGSSAQLSLQLKLRATEQDRPWWDNISHLRYSSYEDLTIVNTWTYTSDGTTRKIYKNGVLEDSAPANPAAVAEFGKFTTGFGEVLQGRLHSVRIYHRALSDTDVKNNAFADSCRFGQRYIKGVLFGSNPATDVTYIDGQHLSAKVPAGAVGETSLSLVDQYDNIIPVTPTYNYYPVMTTVMPSFGSITGGDTITVIGAGFTTNVNGYESANPIVTIGGSTCSNPTVIDFYTMTCQVPESTLPGDHSGIVSIELDIRGQIATGLSYTYVVFSSSPDRGTAVGGTEVTITGGPKLCSASASSYVQDGLILHLDGISNAGIDTPRYTGIPNEWADLSSQANNMSLSTLYQSWGEKSLDTTLAVLNITKRDLTINNGIFTIEFVGERSSYAYAQIGSQYSTAYWLKLRNSSTQAPWWDNGSPLTYSSVDPLGQPNTYAYSSNGSLRAIYLNGILDRTGAANPLAASQAFGRFTTGPAEGFVGKNYAIRVYNRKLSDDQLRLNAAIDECRFGDGSYISDVQFDGVSGTNLAVSEDGTVTVKTPAHPAGVVDITLIDIFGNIFTLDQAFEYEEWLELGVSNSDISFSASLNEASYGYNSLDVTTNHLTGYSLLADSPDLTCVDFPQYKFVRSDGTLASPSSLSPNIWGSQITDAANSANQSAWIGINNSLTPLAQKSVPSGTLIDGESPDSYKFYVGVVPGIETPACTYNNTITITLATRP